MSEKPEPNRAEPEPATPPLKLDGSDYGFDDVPSVQVATRGLLKHFQRLGMTVLPLGQDSPGVIERLSFPQSCDADPQVQGHTPANPTQPALSTENTRPNVEASSRPPATVSSPTPAPRRAQTRPTVAPIHLNPEAGYELPVLSPEDRGAALLAASQQVAACRLCPELVIGRRNTVYGEGNPNPRVCFFGEAPGAEEDQTGRPFVGKAGQLLTKMIKACTFDREETYILNTVKCRPPGNRNPEHDEVENCRGFFEHQFEVLQPEYIVCLGLVAAKALLQTTLPVGRLRGVFHRYKASKVVVTYHPSYLLRNPDAKRAAWDDLQMMLRDMGIDPKATK